MSSAFICLKSGARTPVKNSFLELRMRVWRQFIGGEGRRLSEQIVPTLRGIHLLLQPRAKARKDVPAMVRTQESSYDWKWHASGRLTGLAPPLIHN
jgi:hypothetical protein